MHPLINQQEQKKKKNKKQPQMQSLPNKFSNVLQKEKSIYICIYIYIYKIKKFDNTSA